MTAFQSPFKKLNLRATVFDGVTFCFLGLVALTVLLSPTEEQLLDLSRNSLLAGFLFLAGGALSRALKALRIRTWGEHVFLPAHEKSEDWHRPFWSNFWGWQAVVVIGVTSLVAIRTTEVSFRELFDPSGFEGATRLLKGLANPDWSILPKAVLNMIETIFMAFLATAIAIPIAFVLSFLSARNIMRHPVAYLIYLSLRTVMNVIRSIEALVWAVIFSVWVGIGPFAGMLALMLHSVASLAKLYSEMVESIQEGPVEGVLSTGANHLQTIWFAIVPQVILPYISITVYRWDINVRMATVIGVVGGGGIGTMLMQYQGQGMWPQIGCIVVVIAVVVWLMDQASAYLREALK